MAQPISGDYQYLGSVNALKNVEYSASDFLTSFPGSDKFILKTRASKDNPIMVSINKTPSFEIEFNEVTSYDGTSSLKYIFKQDCKIVIAKVV